MAALSDSSRCLYQGAQYSQGNHQIVCGMVEGKRRRTDFLLLDPSRCCSMLVLYLTFPPPHFMNPFLRLPVLTPAC
jgi:hypothetical protein